MSVRMRKKTSVESEKWTFYINALYLSKENILYMKQACSLQWSVHVDNVDNTNDDEIRIIIII